VADLQIKPLTDISEIEPLLPLSRSEGFRHLDRLVNLWNEGKKFDRPGESILTVICDGRVIGVGGILDQGEGTGRISRVYVHPDFRRFGVGRLLINQLVDDARNHYDQVVLRTDTEIGAAFYESLGFEPVLQKNEDQATHRLVF
jgi:ribosomal protein S18 acetylase RimI-like enzyme